MRADPKKHKRTPSFTTRRRTQSFRRHTKNLNTMENLPPVEVDGFLDRKQVSYCFLVFEKESPEQRNDIGSILRNCNLEESEQQSDLGRATTQSSVDNSCASSGWLSKSTNIFYFNRNHFRDQEDFFEAKAASSPIMIYQVTLNNHKKLKSSL